MEKEIDGTRSKCIKNSSILEKCILFFCKTSQKSAKKLGFLFFLYSNKNEHPRVYFGEELKHFHANLVNGQISPRRSATEKATSLVTQRIIVFITAVPLKLVNYD